jgi:hypothetical protein
LRFVFDFGDPDGDEMIDGPFWVLRETPFARVHGVRAGEFLVVQPIGRQVRDALDPAGLISANPLLAIHLCTLHPVLNTFILSQPETAGRCNPQGNCIDIQLSGAIQSVSMIRRRSTYDALQTTAQPRWLTVRAFTGALLEARRLEPGTDLVRAFLAAMLDLIDPGWRLGEFSSSSAAVRHEHGMEKRMLGIEAQDPEDNSGHRAWGGQCVNCDE